MLKYFTFKWNHSDLSRKILTLSGLSLLVTRSRNKKHMVCTLAICEALWCLYIQYLSHSDIKHARNFDVIKKSDSDRYERLMKDVCNIINIDPRRYWEQMAHPLKLENITEDTAKDIIRCISRDINNMFISDKIVDHIYRNLEHKFKRGPSQKHHLSTWCANK